MARYVSILGHWHYSLNRQSMEVGIVKQGMMVHKAYKTHICVHD